MQVERYNAGRRHTRSRSRWGLGCLFIFMAGALGLLIAGILLLPLLPQITAQIAGFEPIGDTDTVLLTSATPQPAPTRVQPVQSAPSSLTLSTSSYGAVSVNSLDADVRIGESNGAPIVQVSFTERDLLASCRNVSSFCSPSGTPIRNASFDLRTTGLVINGEFNVPQLGLWQPAGIVMQIIGSDQLRVIGVEIDGQVFAAPPNELGQLIAEVERTANDILRQLSAQISGQAYDLREIALADEQLIITLR